MTRTSALVSLQNVALSRGDQPILHDLSLTIEAHAHLAVVGRSGTGKSSLLGLICGVLKAQHGQVCVLGTNLTAQRAAARTRLRAKHMGVVFQNLGLASALSISGNLQLARRMAGLAPDDAFAARLIERLGLGRRARAKPRDLSRGEAQRAAIARALVVRPSLLIADEPTASLDIRWRDAVMDMIFAEADLAGTTVMLSTHDLEVAARFDHQRILSDGASI